MAGFYGRVIAITGAGSGIGQALALELARRGADLALCDVNEEGLAETARRVGTGRKVTSARVDVARRAEVEAFRDQVLAAHGKVDAIVNNAGVTLVESAVDSTYDDLEWIVGINLWGVIHGTKAFLPHLLERGDGWVVNVSSIFGIVAFPSQSAYNATKFAVRGYTESLRQELAGTGVTASCVHPGGIKTNIVRGSRFRRGWERDRTHDEAVEEFERMAKTTPARAATTVADGMERRAPRILIGADAELMERIQRTAPVLYPQIFTRVLQKLRRS